MENNNIPFNVMANNVNPIPDDSQIDAETSAAEQEFAENLAEQYADRNDYDGVEVICEEADVITDPETGKHTIVAAGEATSDVNVIDSDEGANLLERMMNDEERKNIINREVSEEAISEELKNTYAQPSNSFSTE